MKDAVRQTRSHLLDLFEEHGFHPRTDLGQNFLIDINLVEYIARKGELRSRDVVLEVGCGTGGLTTFLAQKAGDVVSVDIDEKMVRLAQSVTKNFENVTLLNLDVLKNKNNVSPDLLALLQEKLNSEPPSQVATLNPPASSLQPQASRRRLKLVANLPYNIATPLVSNLVAGDLIWDRMVITIQWELAARMTGAPGSSDYGALSVWLQSQCFVTILKKMPPTVFWPRPKVESAIVLLRPNFAAKEKIADRAFFHDFIRRLFHLRRKLARSVLCGMYRKQLSKPDIDAVFAELGYDTGLRAEQMQVPELVQLGNRLWERLEA